jgi:hypothetical protein
LKKSWLPTKDNTSTQAVGAGAEEFDEIEVAEDLELLADFVGEGLVGLAPRGRRVKTRSL